jgi:hypothetical protein
MTAAIKIATESMIAHRTTSGTWRDIAIANHLVMSARQIINAASTTPKTTPPAATPVLKPAAPAQINPILVAVPHPTASVRHMQKLSTVRSAGASFPLPCDWPVSRREFTLLVTRDG